MEDRSTAQDPMRLLTDHPKFQTTLEKLQTVLKERELPEVHYDCAECQDSGRIYVNRKEPFRETSYLGFVSCECVRQRAVKALLETIDRRFKRFAVPRLSEMEPRFDCFPDDAEASRLVGAAQASAISLMRKDPFSSFVFGGDNDTGKTHMAYALLVNACEQGRRCVHIKLRDLLDEWGKEARHEPAENGQAFRSTINARDLQDGQWSILIDEFDKTGVTEFKSAELYNFLDEIWRKEHQLIVTVNNRKTVVIDKWSRIDDTYGASIAKRLYSESKGVGLFVDELKARN